MAQYNLTYHIGRSICQHFGHNNGFVFLATSYIVRIMWPISISRIFDQSSRDFPPSMCKLFSFLSNFIWVFFLSRLW
jgi:hypothetical protein